MKTVVSMKFGSHLYGTNTPQSDLDFKSVHIPDAKEILLQRVVGSISDKRDKSEGEKNQPGDTDQESYSLQQFFKLLVDGQTVAIDMLFAHDDMLLETSDLWKLIQSKKHLLLTKKSAAFLGYCRQQANKYGIKGSRVAAARKAANSFQQAISAYGATIKLADIEHVLESLEDEHTSIVDHPVGSSGEMGKFFECCNRKVSFTSTVKQAAEVFGKIYENYGARARLAESNEGVDWKALSHAVRVGYEAIELLTTGNVTFPLPNAEHIMSIKKGELDYSVVSAEIEQLFVDVERASASCWLNVNSIGLNDWHSVLASRCKIASMD